MSLVKCKECGHSISKTCDICPKCGFNCKRYRKNKALKILAIVIIVIVVLGIIGAFTEQEQKKNDASANQITQTQSTKTAFQSKQISKYKFINTKTETTGHGNKMDWNKMDLYTYSGKFDLAALKTLCKKQKEEFTSGMFYFLVVFDNEKNAVFPKDPFTAQFGAEKTASKHIKALYTYNSLNGYSKLVFYNTNSWESLSNMEKI